MPFNSIRFFLFFLSVYLLYLLLDHKRQNRFLLLASYGFYAAWDWRFLSLLLVCTVVNFFTGLKIYESEEPKTKKFYLLLGVISNLTILGFFKYFNFFVRNVQTLASFIGFDTKFPLLNILLPIGVSFYTFQSMTYTIDIYRDQMKPTKNFFDFALFTSFFPLILSGPIERARNLLPQIMAPRHVTWDKFHEGFFLIAWGLFQKIFIADNLAVIQHQIFSHNTPYNGVLVLLAGYAFTFQLYCDFCGYSDIARGICKFIGFDIILNFNLPFFSTNIQEFWNKWHISLSSWVRDYIYTPLFLSLRNIPANLRLYFTMLMTMTLLGLWHGAKWTFVIYGIYQGILLVIYALCKNKVLSKIHFKNPFASATWFFARVVFMFHLTVLGLIVFNSSSISQATEMVKALFFNFHLLAGAGLNSMLLKGLFYVTPLIMVHFIMFLKKDLLFILKSNCLVQALFFYLIFYFIVIFGEQSGKQFIYFKF